MRVRLRTGGAVLLLVAAAAGLPACASRGPVRQEPSTRFRVERPERRTPPGLEAMRGDLAAQRAETQRRMDTALVRPESIDPQPATPFAEQVTTVLNDLLGLGARFLPLLF